VSDGQTTVWRCSMINGIRAGRHTILISRSCGETQAIGQISMEKMKAQRMWATQPPPSIHPSTRRQEYAPLHTHNRQHRRQRDKRAYVRARPRRADRNLASKRAMDRWLIDLHLQVRLSTRLLVYLCGVSVCLAFRLGEETRLLACPVVSLPHS
jgi:hypothetical protein